MPHEERRRPPVSRNARSGVKGCQRRGVPHSAIPAKVNVRLTKRRHPPEQRQAHSAISCQQSGEGRSSEEGTSGSGRTVNPSTPDALRPALQQSPPGKRTEPKAFPQQLKCSPSVVGAARQPRAPAERSVCNGGSERTLTHSIPGLGNGPPQHAEKRENASEASPPSVNGSCRRARLKELIVVCWFEAAPFLHA